MIQKKMKSLILAAILLVMSFSFTVNVGAEQINIPSYSGKWLLFGPNNEYMAYFIATFFDESTEDVYQKDNPNRYVCTRYNWMNATMAGNKSLLTSEDKDIAAIVQEYTEDGYEVSEYEQNGLTVKRFTRLTENEIHGYDLLDMLAIVEDDENFTVIGNMFSFDEASLDTYTRVCDDMFASVQPVDGPDPMIGQYALTGGVYDGPEFTVSGEDRGRVVLTLADKGQGYFWVMDEGWTVIDWSLDGDVLTVEDIEDVTLLTVKDGKLIWGEESGNHYVLEKTNDHVLQPYHVESEEEAEAPEDVHPYAWLGLQEIPQCSYLDLVAGNHYYSEMDHYASLNGSMNISSEKRKAVNGVNEYEKEGDNVSITLDGMIYSYSEKTKSGSSSDMTSLVDTLIENLENHIRNGIPKEDRVFMGTGKEVIPGFAANGDTTEYEYYEYQIDDSFDDWVVITTEKYYMKDGDVYAIYTQQYNKTPNTETTVEEIDVIKSISYDIPDGVLVEPDLTGYEMH